jgi:2-phosphoglycerate kinase
MPERRERRIRSGYGLPYSKGRMADSLIRAGCEPERAYRLAQRIEQAVDDAPEEELSVDELQRIVDAVLGAEDPAMLARYKGWLHVVRLDRPLVVVLGGATGTGKSTLATQLAFRLGIRRITSTDVVREVMRALFANELMPALHFSSFEAGDGLKMPMPDPDAEDRALFGFIQQAEQVAVGVNAVLDRALMEGHSTVVEGIHLVPGLFKPEHAEHAVVVQAVLAVADEEAHQAHFFTRDAATGGVRGMERYLRRFGEIRRIQDYLVTRAERVGVPVIEGSDPDAALAAVTAIIVACAGARPSAVH